MSNCPRKRRRQQNQARVNEYLRTHPCVDCGERDPVVLDFDHVVGDKRADVIKMVHQGCSWETIAEEIAKCQVRCANDHRRRHYRENLYRRLFDGGAD